MSSRPRSLLQLTRNAGLTLEVSAAAEAPLADALLATYGGGRFHASSMAAMDSLFLTSSMPLEIVIDGTRVRMITRDEAIQHWSARK